MGRLFDNALWRLVEPVAVAIRAGDHARGDNRVAPLADLKVPGCGDDFLSFRRAFREMVFVRHGKENSNSREARHLKATEVLMV